jgi:hypothetical protein
MPGLFLSFEYGNSHGKRRSNLNGIFSFNRALYPASAIISTFAGVYDHRRLSFLSISFQDSHQADFNTLVARGAGIFIERNWIKHGLPPLPLLFCISEHVHKYNFWF